ncbi:MAG: arylformamidase [Planctomycetota bacterium]
MSEGRRIWDISEAVSERSAPFPGDTPFTREWVARMADGASCNVSTIRMSVHVGTHADAPLHYDDGGLGSAAVPLDAYLGRCRVLEIEGVGDPSEVPVEALSAIESAGVERVLIRTSARHDGETWNPTFTSVGVAAAEHLVASGVRLVGIDTPSVDHATSKDLPTHQVFRRAGTALLENLDLSSVPPGDYELIALPLKIAGSDAAPVRAILRELES